MGGRIYIFWVLSLMSVEGKMSNINEHLFEMVMWAGFLRLLLFLDGWVMGKVMVVKVEAEVMVKMVVGVVEKVI